MSRILKNTVALTSAHAFTKALAIGMAVAWARFLGAERLGQLSVILSVSAILSVFADAGLNLVTVREVSRRKEIAGAWLRTGLTIKVLLGLMAVLVSLCLATRRDIGAPGFPLVIATIAIVIESAMHLLNAMFRAFERMELEAITQSTWRLAVTVLSVLFLVLGGGVSGVTQGILGGAIVGAAAALWLLKRQRLLERGGPSDAPGAGAMLRLALPYGLQAVLATIYFRVDIVMLSLIRGNTETGYYQAAYHLIEGLLFIPYALSAALFPALSSDFSSGRDDSLSHRLNEGVRFSLMLSLPAAVGLWMVAPVVVPWVFGADFSASAVFLAWLAPAIPLMFANFLLGTAVGAIDRQGQSALATALCVLINIGLNLLLIPRFGGKGAAIATVAAEIVLLISLGGTLLRSGTWRPGFGRIPAIAASTGIMAIAVLAIRNRAPVAAIVVGVVVYGLSILALRGASLAEIRRVRAGVA